MRQKYNLTHWNTRPPLWWYRPTEPSSWLQGLEHTTDVDQNVTWCWPRDEPRPQTDPSVAMAASWPLERSQRSQPAVRSTLDTKSQWEEWEKKHRERIREQKRKGRHGVRGHYLSSSFLHFIILGPSFLSSVPSFWLTSDFGVCFGQRLGWPDHERVPNIANNTILVFTVNSEQNVWKPTALKLNWNEVISLK